MRRFRIYPISVGAGLAGAVTVLGISSHLARQQAEQYIERMRQAPPVPPDFHGGNGYVWGAEFGPGLFTWSLASASR